MSKKNKVPQQYPGYPPYPPQQPLPPMMNQGMQMPGPMPPGMDPKQYENWYKQQQKANKKHSVFYYITMPLWGPLYLLIWLPLKFLWGLLVKLIQWILKMISNLFGVTVKSAMSLLIKGLLWPVKIVLGTVIFAFVAGWIFQKVFNI
ncbi:MAG: hypothetical protein HRS57_00430 [Mycoplasmataceae bacterium]|nr:hypothetical protein [Mycoplasmataceae bacterium]